MRVSTVKKIDDASVSDWSAYSLGCFTGQTMAVGTYVSPSQPALVAYDYADGAVQWTSPLDDLPGAAGRSVAAILLGRMSLNGARPRQYVFAVNPTEFVAYDEKGIRLWKTAIAGIPTPGKHVGAPVSVNFNDAKELVTATDKGWIIKVSPLNGRIIDAYQIRIETTVGGRGYEGIVASFKSIIVVGDVLYLAGDFEPILADRWPRIFAPVFLVRLDLRQRERRANEYRIRRLTPCNDSRVPAPDRILLGVDRSGGSPSAWVTPEGTTVIFANAETLVRSQLRPVVAAIEDNNGLLTRRWWSVLRTIPGDAIHAAPAFHAASRTLLVNTARELYVFRDVDALSGRVPSPTPIPGAQLLDAKLAPAVARAGIGSPIALTYNDATREIISYTNFRIFHRLGGPPYGFLGAFALPAEKPGAPRAVWCEPLAVTAAGHPAPGPGTFGQPALFRYEDDGATSTGLIVNTVATGTYLFK